MFRKKAAKIVSDGNRGFTLVEVLIASVIFAVGVLAVASMQTSAFKGNTTASEITKSSGRAANILENFLAANYSALATGSLPDEDGYSISWTVTEDPGTNSFKTIKVNIEWVDTSGMERETVFKLIRAKAEG